MSTDGKTPGQTLWDAWVDMDSTMLWIDAREVVRVRYERIAAAVLAAHGTLTLTPVGEHTEPGTRGLLPVVLSDTGVWRTPRHVICTPGSEMGRAILADPRPDGAYE